jgi:hypothetical protein
MLISMPTDTSTIFGVFQVIPTSMDFGCAIARYKTKAGVTVTQDFTEKVTPH